MRPPDQSDKRLHGYDPVKVCHHPTTFGDHRPCGSGDIMVLVCLLERPRNQRFVRLYG